MIWIGAILSGLAYAHLAEYSAHRWFMHSPFPWRSTVYVEHAIEHHGRGRTDVNITLSPLTVAAVASPLQVWAIWLGWPWVVTVAALSVVYATWWSLLHAAHHDLRCGWLRRLPGYEYFRRSHLLHHEQPHRNFGTVFPWTDHLFGTVALAPAWVSDWKPAPGRCEPGFGFTCRRCGSLTCFADGVPTSACDCRKETKGGDQ